MSDKRKGPYSELIFGVDIDAVLGDHERIFTEIVAREKGVHPSELPARTEWDTQQWGLSREAFMELHPRAVREDGMFVNMPIMNGAKQALKDIVAGGGYIRIITHRLYAPGNHQNVIGQTSDWLEKHRIPFSDICFVENKTHVHADVYIDDAPHNVEALRATGAPVIVFDQPYNRHMDGPRVSGWDEVGGAILDVTGRKAALMQGQLFNPEESQNVPEAPLDVDATGEDPLQSLSDAAGARDRGKGVSTIERLCGARTSRKSNCRNPVGTGSRCHLHQ